MKVLFSKIGSLIETNLGTNRTDKGLPIINLSNGIWYTVKFSDVDETIGFVSDKKLLFGDKIKITIALEEFGEYVCEHITKDKFLNTTANLIGFKENRIELSNLREDSKEFIRQLSDYENRFNLEIEVA